MSLVQAAELSAAKAAKENKNSNSKAPAISPDESMRFLNLLILHLRGLSTESQSLDRQLRLLRSLSYRTIRLRHSSIKSAHADTFKWALSGQHGFAHWLRNGRGLYWIRGKAGSGKSTLMRFLSENSSTSRYLAEWAHGKKQIVVSHYFWHAGNALQKSRMGLLRTLLFDIFRQCPELIELHCPSVLFNEADLAVDPWREADLLKAFDSMSQATILPAKICFFIDGLDEYTDGEAKYYGSYEELIETLKRLEKSPHFKICVSSRPWTPFEAAFGESENQLQLENLTRSDIHRYVRDHFDSNNKFQTLKDSGALVQKLTSDIVTRAHGVFLWVTLVVDSLLNGLLYDDDVDDLQKRLNELPDDLNEYFRRILETIEPIYWDQSVRIFQMSIDADQALPLLAYECLEHEHINAKYALDISPRTYSRVTTERTHEQMKNRLNARCKDLLEVVEDTAETHVMKQKVDFLHRTVRDFFQDTTAITDVIRERKVTHFDSLLSLSKVMLSLVKIVVFDEQNHSPNLNHFFILIDSLTHYCRKIEHQHKGQPNYREETPLSPRMLEMFEILDELDLVGSKYMSLGGHHWTNRRDEAKGLYQEYQQNSFMGAMIQARISLYIKYRLAADPTRMKKRGRPLLDYALRPTIVTPVDLPDVEVGPSRPIVDLLLRSGADPNQAIYIYDKQTPWEIFLRTYHGHAVREKTLSLESSLSVAEMYETVRLLLSYGADPGVILRVGDNQDVGVIDILKSGLSREDADEVNRMIGLCRQQRAKRMGWVSWAWSALSG